MKTIIIIAILTIKLKNGCPKIFTTIYFLNISLFTRREIGLIIDKIFLLPANKRSLLIINKVINPDDKIKGNIDCENSEEKESIIEPIIKKPKSLINSEHITNSHILMFKGAN